MDLAKVAPARYAEVKKEVKDNANKHHNDNGQNTDRLNKLRSDNNDLMKASLDKQKQLDEVKKAMEGLQDQEENLRKRWNNSLADNKAKIN